MSYYISLNQAIFIEIQNYFTEVYLINRHSIRAVKINKVKLNFVEKKLTLTDVFYIFKLNRNLLLIEAVSRHRVTVKFRLKSVLFKHNRSVIATANQYSSVYIVRSLSRKVTFKVQVYQNSTTSLTLPVTVERDSLALKLTLKLNKAVLNYVINNFITFYTMKGLKYILKNSNSLTQAQTDYLK